MTIRPDRRNLMHLSLVATALNVAPFGTAKANANTGTQDDRAKTADPLHAFDFYFGSWRAQHRRLKERLASNTEWVEFDGSCTVQPLLGGTGNVDDNVINLPGGAYRGVSLRAFDPKTKRWAIWWLDARAPHTLDVPVVGGFENGIGTFYADDTLRGKPIKVRYLWSRITPTSCQWEQAFSPDGAKTWETNWYTYFTRTA